MTVQRRAPAVLSAAACCALAAACGQEPPTSPTPSVETGASAPASGLRISAERYFVQISGIDLTEDFSPWCQPMAVPRAGKFLTTFVWFRREGDEFVGRPSAAARSSLEIRLRRVDVSHGVASVEGTVTGSAQDEYDRMLGARDLMVSIAPDAPASFTGSVTHQHDSPIAPSPLISGTMAGPITFADSSGAISRCPTASLLFQVAPPGGPHDDPTVPPIVPGVLR